MENKQKRWQDLVTPSGRSFITIEEEKYYELILNIRAKNCWLDSYNLHYIEEVSSSPVGKMINDNCVRFKLRYRMSQV